MKRKNIKTGRKVKSKSGKLFLIGHVTKHQVVLVNQSTKKAKIVQIQTVVAGYSEV